MVLHRYVLTDKLVFINRVDNVDWPQKKDFQEQTFQTLAPLQSESVEQQFSKGVKNQDRIIYNKNKSEHHH